jgi:hypothetical protein
MHQNQPFSLPISRENQMLLCAASVADKDTRTSRFRELMNPGLHWECILDNARHHDFNAMLYRQLAKTQLDQVPPAIAGELKNDYMHTVGRNMCMVQELVGLIELFRSASIPLLPYKGLTLTHDLYGDIACRQMADIDVLVKEYDVERAKHLLLKNGYTPEKDLASREIQKLREQDCEEVFCSPKHRISIELHWRLLPPVTSRAADWEDIWDHVRDTRIFGVRTLSLEPEWNALVVFLHAGIKHRWKEIKLIADAARILEKYQDMDWHAVLHQADARNEEFIILLGAYLARSLMGAAMPEIIAARIECYPQIRAFAGLAMGRIFREDHGLPGFKEWRRYTRALHQNNGSDKRSWSPLEEFMRYTVAILTPEFKDKYQLLGLPNQLTWLHYFSRPIRLARQQGVELVGRAR